MFSVPPQEPFFRAPPLGAWVRGSVRSRHLWRAVHVGVIAGTGQVHGTLVSRVMSVSMVPYPIDDIILALRNCAGSLTADHCDRKARLLSLLLKLYTGQPLSETTVTWPCQCYIPTWTVKYYVYACMHAHAHLVFYLSYDCQIYTESQLYSAPCLGLPN